MFQGPNVWIPTGGMMFGSWGNIYPKCYGTEYPGVAVETLKP